jgi:type IV pilus assembly protein PilA
MSGPAPRPVHRGYAIASLVLGILSIPTLGLLLVGAMVSVILGVVALVKESRQPEEYGGKGMAITGIVLSGVSILVVPFFAGIIAAIAIPSVLRARVSANEAAALGDVRDVIRAEAAYQAENGGYFDRLECLAAPATCIPGHHGASLIADRLLSTGEDQGYRRVFHPGPRAEPVPPKASPTSLMAFAYVATPISPGKSGVRTFCGDGTGVICHATGPVVPELGVCPADCKPF